MPDIKVVPSTWQHEDLELYLKARNITFEYYDKWDFATKNRFVVPKGDCLLIMPYILLQDLHIDSFINDVNSSNCSIYFCQSRDVIHSGSLRYEKYIKQITRPVYLHVDGILHKQDNRVVTTKYQNTGVIDNVYLDTNQSRNKDFLITTIVKPGRPHRKMLVDKLEQAKLLSNYAGVIRYNNQSNSAASTMVGEWVGTTSWDHNQKWMDGKIYWDLYNSVFYEIVPECFYKDASYPTEKTWKPIVAKIPFIVLSDYKYYDTLHSLGFRTFDGIIDESFAREPNLEKRVDKIINTISKIVPKKFYDNTRDICEHNYRKLCEFHFENKNKFVQQLDELFKDHVRY